jgi:2-oxoglutarate ferredoxin oxidoreductase subunit alpha
MGNQALCLGLVAASHKSGLPIMLGSYPITPASDILHQLSTYKNHGVMTFQAEDEIAAVCAAIGASYAGQIGVTSTSGPGLALKTEAVGLAVMTELPLVIVNVQRAGPSTGMPTKTEQADLLQSLYGRHGESPVGVIACSTPSDAFDCAFEAVRLSLTHMAPVILLSDGYIANGSEPWKIPAADSLPEIPVKFATERQDDEAPFLPYARDPKTLARPWAKPGTPGLMHRIGGLEKADGTGHISYDPQNHEHMVRMRAEKIERMADSIPEQDTLGPDSGDLLVLSWGGTRGAVTGAVQRLQKAGHKVSAASIRYLNPLPKNLGDLMRRFRRVCCVEINTGQLAMVLRARFLIDIQPVTKVQGQPFGAQELLDRLQAQLDAVGNAGANTNGV